MSNRTFFERLYDLRPATTWAVDPSKVDGYSDEEISRIESTYEVKIRGQLRDFLLSMGRCDGGLIGDDPIILYRDTWGAEGQRGFQKAFREGLKDSNLQELCTAKPFAFSCESETQYYFVMTEADDPDLVFHFDENEEIVDPTNMVLLEYMKWVLDRYVVAGRAGSVVCRGSLLR